MIKSMTGFGRGEYADAVLQCAVEIKTVNHRYNDIMIRIPKVLNPLEDKIRSLILQRLKRGHMEVFITLKGASLESEIKVDKVLAISYHKAVKELSQLTNSEFLHDVYELARFPDVLTREENECDLKKIQDKIYWAVNSAIDEIIEMRTIEGENILADLEKRVEFLSVQVASIKDYADEVVESYRSKLRIRVDEITKNSNITVDESRIMQEVALFADKSNITEEIVRLDSHLKQFSTSIHSNSDTIGRKLDFIIQEINREINTIASKANSFLIANIVVNMKSEVEKIREQVQNIE